MNIIIIIQIVGVVLSTLSIATANVERVDGRKHEAIQGFVLGVIGMVTSLALLPVWIMGW